MPRRLHHQAYCWLYGTPSSSSILLTIWDAFIIKHTADYMGRTAYFQVTETVVEWLNLWERPPIFWVFVAGVLNTNKTTQMSNVTFYCGHKYRQINRYKTPHIECPWGVWRAHGLDWCQEVLLVCSPVTMECNKILNPMSNNHLPFSNSEGKCFECTITSLQSKFSLQ